MRINPTTVKNYNAVDIFRFVLALVIVCSHFASGVQFPALIDDAFSIYVIAVPFFYSCSAYLLFRNSVNSDATQRWQAFRKYAKRILIMYLVWSGIYFPFVLIGWFQTQAQASVILSYFHRALVFTTYATIWFLPALLIGVAIVQFLLLRFSFLSILVVSMVFYLLGTFGYSYSFLLPEIPKIESIYQFYERWFFTTRNGVFNAFPFVAIGAWIATRKARIPTKLSAFMSIIFLILLVVEAYTLRLKFGVGGVDTAISLFPFTFFFLEFLLGIELSDRVIYRFLRDMSVLIFLSHRLYVSAFPSVLPETFSSIMFSNSWLALTGIILLTLTQSWLIIKLSDKYSFLRILR